MRGAETVDEFLSRARANVDNRLGVMLDAILEVIDAQLAAEDANIETGIEQLRTRFIKDEHALSDEKERELASQDLDEWTRHWHCYVKSCSMGAALSLKAFRSAMAMGKTHANMEQVGLALSTVHTMRAPKPTLSS